MDRAAYEAVLAQRFIPASIVATRPSTPTRRLRLGWQRGERRDLRHNCWLIQTSDSAKKRGDEHIVSFDSRIDFPMRSLSDAEFTSDRLSKKLLVLSCLTIGPRDHGDLSGRYVSQIASKFDWLLRHRQAEGIHSFGCLPPGFAKKLASRLSLGGGALSLIPIEERIQQLAEEARERRWVLPLKEKGEIDWLKLADALGTSVQSLTGSIDVKTALVDLFPELSERALSRLARTNTTMSGVATDEPLDSDLHILSSDEDSTEITPKHKMKAMALKSYMETLEFLYRVLSKPSSHDLMQLYPFEITSAEALLDRYGKDSERTPTILPQEMLRLMTEASRWVGVYGDYIASALDEYKRAQAIGTQPCSDAVAGQRPIGAPKVHLHWTHASRPIDAGELSLDTAVKYLLASCAILIASFAARRSVGVESVHFGCLIQHANGLIEMTLYIGKTRQDYVNIPVPDIIRKVVRVLERLSAHVRLATGRHWLFEVAFNDANPSRLISLSFNSTIKEFLDFSIPPPDGHDRWTVAMHQLRRGYGIWYYYGLEGATGDALSLMYMHNDPRMARIYVTMELPGQINELRKDLEAKRRVAAENRTPEENAWIENVQQRLSYLNEHASTFNDVRCEFFVQKMIAIWKGVESVIGLGGKALYADLQAIVAKAMTTIRIGSASNDPAAFDDLLVDQFWKYASTNFLEPVIGTNLWCRARPADQNDLAKANCLILKGRVLEAPWDRNDFQLRDLLPDFDFAGNRVCIGCHHCVAFSKGQQALQAQLDNDRAYAERAATRTIREEAEFLLHELERAILNAGPPLTGTSHEQ
ncbi:hypothetical protein CN166_12465 [Sinorhizobium medicae]|uniref:hypothetical protein n=1 Tax=Sinorhizobium medicae TaxID=110321 RepID=UPI000FD38E77|nr:hypothetical protein [Sinorhizobium medicae]RVJ59499.1 hypothetical protein CN166_12465 [Sinorhizobium medicae]